MLRNLHIVYIILALIWIVSVIWAFASNSAWWSKVKESRKKAKDHVKIEKPKEESKKVSMKNYPPHLAEYHAALERGDKDGMRAALLKNYEECPAKHGYCLTEVFCPECPLGNGGLVVRSAREGWE